jgi:hypothetical protein
MSTLHRHETADTAASCGALSRLIGNAEDLDLHGAFARAVEFGENH